MAVWQRLTPQGFFHLIENTFTVPNNTGQSYSFTKDGHWEQAIYMTQPNRA